MSEQVTYLCVACEIAITKAKCRSHRELAQLLKPQIDSILELSGSPNEAFYQLYLLFKEHSSKMSLSFLCKQLNLSSKGSLNLAMKHKRGVSRETAQGIPVIFHLNAQQRDRWFTLFTQYRSRWLEYNHISEIPVSSVVETTQ